MKIVHRIGISPDNKQREVLKKIGLEVPSPDNPLVSSVTFDLDESSREYQELKPYIKEWGLFEAVGTLFTEQEIDNAKLLMSKGVWANGYPMPESNFGYKKTTYSDKDHCSSCGIGLIQKEPFRLKKAPNWGNKKMFSLNWVFDELFVRKDLYESVFKKYEIDCLPVLVNKKETVIEDTVQLVIPTTTSSLKLDGYEFHICAVCGRKRYNLIKKGFIPPFQRDTPSEALFKSNEYFGTGANARKYIFVSAELRKELQNQKVKIDYIPVANS
jgi:hypothetical protein